MNAVVTQQPAAAPSAQDAALQGALQGAEAAAVIGLGVASAADPRVGAAMDGAKLALQLMNTAHQLNDIGKMSDAQLLTLWAQTGQQLAADHAAIFGSSALAAASPTPVPAAVAPASSGSAS